MIPRYLPFKVETESRALHVKIHQEDCLEIESPYDCYEIRYLVHVLVSGIQRICGAVEASCIEEQANTRIRS